MSERAKGAAAEGGTVRTSTAPPSPRSAQKDRACDDRAPACAMMRACARRRRAYADLSDAVGGQLGGELRAIATENSRVEKLAKGCLMARSSVEADAAYVAASR